MKRLQKVCSLALIFSLILTLLAVPAAAAESSDILSSDGLAEISQSVLLQTHSAIEGGELLNGVYSDIVFPEAFLIGNYALNAAQYVYLAAQAIMNISDGAAYSDSLTYSGILLEQGSAFGSNVSAISAADYRLLAEHICKYVSGVGTMPTSFCLSSGDCICIYSICEIFAAALSQYHSSGTLPASVSFLASNYTTAQTNAASDIYPKICSAATELANDIEQYGALPDTVVFGTSTLTCQKLLPLMCRALINISNGTTAGSIPQSSPSKAPNPSENATAGTINKTDYLTYTQNILNFITNNNYCPNYVTTSLGQIRYENYLYSMAKVLRYYQKNNRLPTTVSVLPWENVIENAGATEIAQSDTINGIWLWPSTVYNLGSGGAIQLMKKYADVGITDVYLLVKGSAGSCAWNTSVSGAAKTYASRDILEECCNAAAPYGIRIHCWMMCARDDNYLSSHSSAAYYHFRYGTGTSVTRYVNLRNPGYVSYFKNLVREILSNYNVAGIHLDTIRYGALFYDWGTETQNLLTGRTYGLTKAQYNAAVQAMCVYANTTADASYKYTQNSEGYYIYSSTGTTPTGKTLTEALSLTDQSDLAIAAQAVYEMRTDTVKNFASEIAAVCGNKVVSAATMPEAATSKASAMIYAQDSAKLGAVTDYICPMTYSVDYKQSSSWVKSVTKTVAKAGANVVSAIQTYDNDDGTEATGTTVFNDMNAVRSAAAESAVDGSISGKVLGSAFFREYYTGLSGIVCNERNNTATFCIYAPENKDVTRLKITLQNGMTVDSSRFFGGFTDKTGWGNADFSISTDRKTITIYNNGADIIKAKGNSAGFTLALSGTFDARTGVAEICTWDGTDAGISATVLRSAYKQVPDHTACSGAEIEFWQNGDGTHSAFCYECGMQFDETCVIEQTAHTAPSCTQEGSRVFGCVGGVNPITGEIEHNAFSAGYGCGYTETETIAMTDHSLLYATDNADGTHSGLCTVCGNECTQAHISDNGVCAICGAYQNALLYSVCTDLHSADQYVIAYETDGAYYALTTRTTAISGTNAIEASRLYLDAAGKAIVADESDYAVFAPSVQTNSYTQMTGLTMQEANGRYLVLPNNGLGFSSYFTNGFFKAETGSDNRVRLKMDDAVNTRFISVDPHGYFIMDTKGTELYLFGLSNVQIVHHGEESTDLTVAIGEEGTLSYTLNVPRYSVTPVWSSENPEVFCVDEQTGAWSASEIGTTKVTLSLYTYDDTFTDFQLYTAELTVTVTDLPHQHEVSCQCSEDGAVVFEALTQTTGTLAGGNYYLQSDLTMTGNLTVTGSVNLCLNGHLLTAGNHILNIGRDATLNLCDCRRAGEISGASYGIAINGGTLNQFGGKICAASTSVCYGAELENGGNMNLYGGEIRCAGSGSNAFGIRNYSTGTVLIDGGTVLCSGTNPAYYGIYNYSTGTVQISSGSVTGPYAVVNRGLLTLSGGTVSARYYGAVLVSGSCTINGKTIMSGAEADFYIGNASAIMLHEPTPPAQPYTVERQTMPTAGGNTTFTSEYLTSAGNIQPIEFFSSADPRYSVILVGREAALHLHDYSAYTDNGDGTHTLCCSGCDYTQTETHSFAEGSCVCGAVEGPDADDLKISSAYLRLSEDIHVIFTASVPQGFENLYMEFTYLGRTDTVSDYSVNEAGEYCFDFGKVTPQCMGENISATLYASYNGKVYTDTVAEYSIRAYCENMLQKNAENSKLVTLLSDLLSYGAAAQNYIGYRTESLVTAGLDLSPSTFTELTGKRVSFTGEQAEDTCWTSASLVLGDDVAARFTFRTDDTSDLTLRVSVNGRTKLFTADDFTSDNGRYYITYDGIRAAEFDDTVTASFFRSDEQIGATVNYSVNTYICSTQNSTSLPTLAELVKALYNYGESAKQYADHG